MSRVILDIAPCREDFEEVRRYIAEKFHKKPEDISDETARQWYRFFLEEKYGDAIEDLEKRLMEGEEVVSVSGERYTKEKGAEKLTFTVSSIDELEEVWKGCNRLLISEEGGRMEIRYEFLDDDQCRYGEFYVMKLQEWKNRKKS